MVPSRAAAPQATKPFLSNRLTSLYTRPATTPIIIRGTRAISRARGSPESVPGMGIKGEKTKEVRLGSMVFLIRLVTPMVRPSTAPALGPRMMAPIMTGICTVVALMNTRGIYPSTGIKETATTNAIIRASSTIYAVFLPFSGMFFATENSLLWLLSM